MLGMDMMIKTVVKAVGLDPETFPHQMETFLKTVWGRVQEFDNRLNRLEDHHDDTLNEIAKLNHALRKLHPELFDQPQIENEKETEDESA